MERTRSCAFSCHFLFVDCSVKVKWLINERKLPERTNESFCCVLLEKGELMNNLLLYSLLVKRQKDLSLIAFHVQTKRARKCFPLTLTLTFWALPSWLLVYTKWKRWEFIADNFNIIRPPVHFDVGIVGVHFLASLTYKLSSYFINVLINSFCCS